MDNKSSKKVARIAQPIGHDFLMEKSRQLALKAMVSLDEILDNADCKASDIVAAARVAVDIHIKLAGLVEVESIDSLPVLRAISNAGN